MPHAVYSTRFFRIPAFAGGPTVAFAAPAGFVTIVRTIGIVTGSAATSQSAWVEADDGSKLVWHFTSGSLTTDPLTTIFDGRWVMLPGETLATATDTLTTADFWCSGYLLAA